MHNQRPSNRELSKRLEEAKESLKKRFGIFASPSKVVGELNNLHLGSADDVWPLIEKLLEEISFKDYKGGMPPQKSYEKTIAECELWAFSWWSPTLNKQMYIKFALKDSLYCYVSLHQSRSKEQKEE